jgi:hypothetical protein
VKTDLKEYSEIEAQDGYAWSDGDCEVVERSTLVWVSTEERSNAATIKALAWPGDHDFIETSNLNTVKIRRSRCSNMTITRK